MMQSDGLDLPPRKVEYLKYLRENGDSGKIGEMAARFSVDPSTVSKVVQELASTGLVAHRPYGRVVLTGEGALHAEFLLRRHRILALILTHYGLEGTEACREASRFESYVSRDAVNKICRSLGHPTKGICGSISHEPGCE
ncbi:MAG: metal-dependent transcriptional regulator [Methanolinea sp.]|nr:metal-dependent transcriptional regulator [Methanolinea sp.]